MQTVSPTIDDLITRGIPGAILVASIVVGALGDLPSLDSNAVVIGFIAVSYTAGTLLDLHKHDVFTAPPHFRRILYSSDGHDEDYLRGITQLGLYIRRSRVVKRYNQLPLFPNLSRELDYGRESIFSENGESIVETIETESQFEVSPENLKQAWTSVEGEVAPELNRIGRSQHTIYHFLLNFFLSVILSIVLLIYGIVVVQPAPLSVGLLLLLPLLAVVLIEVNLFAKYGTRYSKQVVKEYYIQNLN